MTFMTLFRINFPYFCSFLLAVRPIWWIIKSKLQKSKFSHVKIGKLAWDGCWDAWESRQVKRVCSAYSVHNNLTIYIWTKERRADVFFDLAIKSQSLRHPYRLSGRNIISWPLIVMWIVGTFHPKISSHVMPLRFRQLNTKSSQFAR